MHQSYYLQHYIQKYKQKNYFEVHVAILKTHIPGPGSMGRNPYGPRIGSVYQMEHKLGSGPESVYFMNRNIK